MFLYALLITYLIFQIMDGLIRSLNNVYSLFVENYPNFDGPISIYAHSLGSVMCYDLLTSWSPLVLYDKYVAETIVSVVVMSWLGMQKNPDISSRDEICPRRFELPDHF